MRRGSRARLRVACDVVVAVAAVVTIMASFWPWYQATLTPDMTGLVPAPSGSATGVYAHPSLWAAVGLAAAQIALLAARYCPGGRLRVPRDDILLVVVSGLACFLVLGDMLLVPGPWADVMTPVGVPFPWEGVRYPVADATTLVMTWRYGAVVAVAAAVASLAVAVASLVLAELTPRSKPTRVLAPPSW
jgi:hypothetical protein